VKQNKLLSFITTSHAFFTSTAALPTYAFVVITTLLDFKPGEVAAS
jgi:hypothetical protein